MRSVPNILRWTMSIVGAFALGTLCWVLWGLITPGDYFANGSPMFPFSFVISVMIGLTLGYSVRSRAFRYFFVGLAVLALAFWLFVPEGWWAKGPPGL